MHQPPRFLELFRFWTAATASTATSAAASTSTSSSAPAAPAALRAVAPPFLLRGFLVLALLAPVFQVLLAPFVQGLEQREVELHELRGEPFAVARVRQRKLVQKHRGVVLRFQADAFPETKRFNLARDDSFHRGVFLGNQL